MDANEADDLDNQIRQVAHTLIETGYDDNVELPVNFVIQVKDLLNEIDIVEVLGEDDSDWLAFTLNDFKIMRNNAINALSVRLNRETVKIPIEKISDVLRFLNEFSTQLDLSYKLI